MSAKKFVIFYCLLITSPVIFLYCAECFLHKSYITITIAIVADPHYFGENATQKRDMMRQYCGDWMREFSDRAKNARADAIFQLGDLTDPCYDWGVPAPCNLTCRYMEDAMNILNDSGLPVYSVLGNHEINTENCTKSIVAPILGLPTPLYYSFDIGQFHFIALDNFDVNCLYNISHQEHFRIVEAQKNWLISDLDANIDKPTIVLTHVPLSGYFENVEKDHFRMYNSHRNGPEIREILRRYPNVIAVLEGHFHNITYYDVSMYKTYLWKDGHIRYIGIPSLTNQYSQNCYGILHLSEGRFRLKTTSSLGRVVKFGWSID